jgi:ElaA protein
VAAHGGLPELKVVAVSFEELDPRTAYDVWRLRHQVFVLEQQCLYGDLDGRDLEPGTRHVVMTEDAAVVGYARVLDDGDTWRIGRVVLATEARGRGWADPLMHATLAECPDRDIVLNAQAPLAAWYSSLGFEVTGPEYLDDGIPHLPMRRSGRFTA